MDNILATVSTEFRALVSEAGNGLLHLYTDSAQGRTAVRLGNGEAVTVAMDASIDEEVSLLDVEGKHGVGRVTGYDETTGVVLLALPTELAGPSLTLGESEVAVGTLGVTVAYPSPQGVEARLEMVRCVAGPLRLPAGATVSRYIQTDSLSYPGFLGAPLISPEGTVSAVALPSGRRGDNLLMPASQLASVIEALRSTPRIGVGYIGIRGQEAPLPRKVGQRDRGFLTTKVEEDSPAEAAGVQVGDFLLTLDDTEVTSLHTLFEALIGAPKRDAAVTLLRGGEVRQLRVELRPRRRR